MPQETDEHKKMKEMGKANLKTQGCSVLEEYSNSGNIHDVNAVTSDGISIFVENVCITH